VPLILIEKGGWLAVFFVVMGECLCLCGLVPRLGVSRDVKKGGRNPILQSEELFKQDQVTLTLYKDSLLFIVRLQLL
jgi:hypothetical protein